MRTIVIAVALLPYARYAALDFAFHRHDRRPPIAEQILHAVIALLVGGLVLSAFADDLWRFVAFLALFAIMGGIDELAFHRGLPARESDLHAKDHICLLLFVAVVLASHVPRNALSALAHEGRRLW